jgi:hypothetical protein
MYLSSSDANYIKTQLKYELEKQEEKSCIDLMPTTKPDISKILQSIMSDGAEKFKEKTGREMTYSEMRELYG